MALLNSKGEALETGVASESGVWQDAAGVSIWVQAGDQIPPGASQPGEPVKPAKKRVSGKARKGPAEDK